MLSGVALVGDAGAWHRIDSNAGHGDHPPTIAPGESLTVIGPHHTDPNHAGTQTHFFAETEDEHHFAWLDQDPSTSDVIDIFYDYRNLPGRWGANQITDGQIAMVELALRKWEDATFGKIQFSQNTTTSRSNIINVGTGDLKAWDSSNISEPGGILGLGGGTYSHNSDHTITGGIAWMDFAENWDEANGNGNPSGTFDYFTVAAQEIGHALGLGHNEDLGGTNIMNGSYTGEVTEYSANDFEHIQVLYGAGTPPDALPTLNITSPLGGATVSGTTVAVSGNASDDNGVSQVEFFVDGASIGVDSDGSDGWSVTWDSTTVADGGHSVTATATDTVGQTANDSITVNVDQTPNNPPTSPTNLLATRVLHDKATVWWNSSTDLNGDAISYDVQYRGEDLSTSWISTSGTSGTRMTMSGLDANTSYRVRVRASDGQNLSAWNTRTDFFTTEPPVSVPGFFGEVGMLTNLTDQAQTVLFQQSYLQPVVFAQSPSYNGVEEVVVRVSDVQSDRFTIYLQEPSNRNGKHTTETVSYVVLEAGMWQLPGGTLVEVGMVDTSATAGSQMAGSQFEIVTFANPFSTTPVVLSQIQTTNFNPSFLKTRQTGTTSSGFQLALDVEEVVTVPHGQETVGYLAIEAGAGSWGSIAFEAVTTPAVIDSTGVNISFNQSFGQVPRFLSSLASYTGKNPAQLRYDNLTGSGVQVRVEEEITLDAEVFHSAESISYLVLGGNGLLAGAPLIGQVLGETGTLVNLTDQPQTILLHATYNNPVVLAQSASRNGVEPVVVRVTDVQADRFTIYLQEPSDRNGRHTKETVSYLVLEAGSWQLSDGTLIEAGQVSTSATVGGQLSNQWETVSLESPWVNSPVVLSQVQTANDPSFVKTRQQDFAAGSFQIALEGEEDDTLPHGLETIGYLAMEAGRGDLGVVEYEAFTTTALFSHLGTTWTFNESFDQLPGFLSSLSGYIGSNAAQLRYDSLNETGVRVYVEEDTTFDAEISHTAESISYLAFSGNGLLTGQPQAGEVIGQAGTITDLTDQPQVILLDRGYVNPVVIAQPPSYYGLEEVVVRITDVQSDRFTIFLQEPSNRNGTHTTETVSYLVLEAGQWQLADGSLLEAGNLTTAATVGGQLASPQWATVQFTDAFDTAPVVLSQVQTANDTSFVKTRQRNPSGGSVEIALEGEEAAASPHGTETIGYLALQPGAGSWGGMIFEAFTTPADVSVAGGKLNFTRNFPSAPVLFASISSYAGSNSAALRHAELTDAAFQAFVEEDTTLDEEKAHVGESISYLALGGGGPLLATANNAAATSSLDSAISMFAPSDDLLVEPNHDPLWLDVLLLAHAVDGNTSDTDAARQLRSPGNAPSLHISNTISTDGPVRSGVAAWMSTFRNGRGNNPPKDSDAMPLDWDFTALEHDDADWSILRAMW